MLGLAIMLLSAGLLVSADNANWQNAQTVYEFTVKDIHGQEVSLEKYRGHVLILVNVASECGLTDRNYQQLVQLHEKYAASHGLRILAFPCNQFNNQEPGTPEQILEFVKKYDVKFHMMEKIEVNGDNAHPVYKWLRSPATGLGVDDIEWNFVKFIVNKDGVPVRRYKKTDDPLTLEPELMTYF